MALALITKVLASIVYWVLRKQEALSGQFPEYVLTPNPRGGRGWRAREVELTPRASHG